jgi:signal peptidase II
LNRKLLIFAVVTILGIVADQATKYWVRADPAINQPGGMKVIPHFFSIVHAENPGAAFGMLGDLSDGWRIALFLGFTAVATVIVFDMYRKLPSNDIYQSTTLGLIWSGALGNAIDRSFKPIFGANDSRGQLSYSPTVTDFLRFYTDDPEWVKWLDGLFGMSEYPSFNIADANLFVGVGMFVLHYLFVEGREERAPKPSAPPGPSGAPAAESVVDATYGADSSPTDGPKST